MGKKAEKSRTEKMLSQRTNPLATISIIHDANSVGAHVGRSMGFITERFEDGLRLIATCRHALMGRRRYDRSFIVGIENPMPTIVEGVGQPIEDPDPRSDVAFLVVRDPLDVPSKCFALRAEDQPKLQHTRTLYNVQNTCQPLIRQYGTTINKQAVGPETTKPYRNLLKGAKTWSAPFEDVDANRRFVEEGWIEHRRFTMVSRRGFSGSPIWDEELNFYGMVTAGSAPGDESHEQFGDCCICLPTSQLFLARQRIDRELQNLLAAVKNRR